MLAFIDPSALPALRTAGIFFLIIDLLAAVYILIGDRHFSVPTAEVLRATAFEFGQWSAASGRSKLAEPWRPHPLDHEVPRFLPFPSPLYPRGPVILV